jgi:hypothetical protein
VSDDEQLNRERNHRRDAVRALRVGAVLVLIGIPLAFSPLAWGRSFPWNKYLVLCGILVVFLGAGLILNGGLDWFRSKR